MKREERGVLEKIGSLQTMRSLIRGTSGDWQANCAACLLRPRSRVNQTLGFEKGQSVSRLLELGIGLESSGKFASLRVRWLGHLSGKHAH